MFLPVGVKIVFGENYFYHYNLKTGKQAKKTGKGVASVLTTSHPHTKLEDFMDANIDKSIYVYANPKGGSIYWKECDIMGDEIGEPHILRAVAF